MDAFGDDDPALHAVEKLSHQSHFAACVAEPHEVAR
jgi:hypothetical protein